MATRDGQRLGTPRRSSRISGRSETPDSRRALSPDLVEQMTPRRAGRAALATFRPIASGSTSVSVKQEDAPARFFVREESREPSYQPAILRGDQRSFNDARDANNSMSASLSLFSSEGDPTDNYQQEEQEVAQMQTAEQQRPAARATVTRRTSGQRKGRTSADNLLYKPTRDEEEDDDDDDVGSPSRSRRKIRASNSNSVSARLIGRIDNETWMTSTKRKGRRKSTNGVPGELEDDDSRETNEEEDAEAGSGKETRFDGVSDSESANDDDVLGEVALGNHILTARADKVPSQPEETNDPPALNRLWTAVASYTHSLILLLLKLPGLVSDSRPLQWLLAAAAVGFLARQFLGPSNLSKRAHYLFDDDVPGSSSSSIALSLDKENQRLRSELNRLTSRLDTLASSIDAQITSSLSSAAAKIQADADARHSTELNRLTASTKRTVSRLAQDELKSIQDSVSSSVELMLRDLDKKVNVQLKQRADDTEGKFLNKLEREVGRIAKYANDEVNARLGQAFDRTFVSELIEERLEKYSRDRTGRVDWAAVTSGGWVGEEGTVHRGYRLNSVWNVGRFLAQGRKVAIGEPIKAITPGVAGLGVGNCWMTGWDSWLQVNLIEPKVVDEVVVEHALPGMTRTAPRRILVWAHVDESDRHYFLQYRRSKADTQDEYLRTILPEPFYAAVPEEYKREGGAPLLLAHFEFQATGSTLQTFNLTEEAQVYPFGVKATRWQFVDGWAKNPPICVHRVRVHGSDWPVFADRLAD